MIWQACTAKAGRIELRGKDDEFLGAIEPRGGSWLVIDRHGEDLSFRALKEEARALAEKMAVK